MDFISTILAALMAGAATGGQATASQAVKDAYYALKTLLQNKITGKQNAQLILSKYEEKPEIWKEPLKDALIQIHADQDKEIARVTQILLELLSQQQAAEGTFVIYNTGTMQGTVQGDHNTNTFNIDNRGNEDL
jgi:DNA-binding SARP family transcriptional activator